MRDPQKHSCPEQGEEPTKNQPPIDFKYEN